MKKHQNMFASLYALANQPALTPKSKQNTEIEKNRPDPNTGGGVPFSSGGGKFYTRRMISNLKHTKCVLDAKAKRDKTIPRPLFYGDAW